MATVSYQDVYIVNVTIRSISGRNTITEEDLGLQKGTLPPSDVASLGSLITVDKHLLRPFNTLRAKTKRCCEGKGVRVGFGTVVPESALVSLMDELNGLRDEFYREKARFLDKFQATLDERINTHPKFGRLIQAKSPTYEYVSHRLSFEIDVTKVIAPGGDAHEEVLAATLDRDANDISSQLLREVAIFCESFYERSMREPQSVSRRGLSALRSVLPKLKSFQLLDGRLSVITDTFASLLQWAEDQMANYPADQPKLLIGGDYQLFADQFAVFRDATRLIKLMQSHQPATPSRVAPARPVAQTTAQTGNSLSKVPSAPPPIVSPPARKRIAF